MEKYKSSTPRLDLAEASSHNSNAYTTSTREQDTVSTRSTSEPQVPRAGGSVPPLCV